MDFFTVFFSHAVPCLLVYPIGYIVGRRRRVENIDYKQRWQKAVTLLGETGQITDDEKQAIASPKKEKHIKAEILPEMSQTELNTMASWDRKDLEVARAKANLPRLDNLKGMASWDKTAVLTAHAKKHSN